MAYMKHSELGNKHVPDSEVDRLTAEGWVKWPRTKEQKAGAAPVKAIDVIKAATGNDEPSEAEVAAGMASLNEIVGQTPKQKRKYTRKA